MQPISDMAAAETAETTFQRETRALRVEEGHYRCTLSEHWSMDRGPNGGYLAALLLDSLTRTLALPTHHPRSFNVRFLAGAQAGTADVYTRVERTGQSLAWLTAELRQGDRLCMVASVAMSKDRPSLECAPLRAPSGLPEPGEVALLTVPGMPPITQHYEYRSLYATPVTPCSDERVGGFIRLREPQQIDLSVLTALADAWFPASYARDRRMISGATVELTIHFRNHAALSELASDAHLYTVFTSRYASAGFVDEDGEIWTVDGRLLAQSRQLRIATPFA